VPAIAPLPPGHAAAALVIFVLTYAVLGLGSLPTLRIDRTGAALIGATAMVAFGVLTPRQAAGAIDFHTLGLLFGMMLVVAHLRLAGFFQLVTTRCLGLTRDPRRVLALTVWLSGALSALFVNDTACILLTPLALEVAASLGRAPAPFLLAVAMGANAGSVATLVGNPQNMLVASYSGIGYARFALVLLPVAVVALGLTTGALLLFFRRDLARAPGPPGAAPHEAAIDRRLLVKSLAVTALLMVALIAGVTPSVAALIAASVLLITRRVDPDAVFAQVDWGLLTLFAGLFVVVEGVERSSLTARALAGLGDSARGSFAAFVGITAAVSNLVSNVPAVLVLKGWAAGFAPPERAWLGLAMASTLAGNLTIVGSVANLIVVEQARGRGAPGFWTYAKVGVPLTLLALAIGSAWVYWVT
jgi:Na+/H+ antiporter NhaD/arsenite permease-like protein